MIDHFKMKAPLAWNGKFLPTSGFGRLAAALGTMTGGMARDGSTFQLDALDYGLMCAQIIASEAGLAQIVCGIGFDVDGRHNFVAMADGTIWRFVSYYESGSLVTEGSLCSPDFVVDNCEECNEVMESVKSIVIDALKSSGNLDDNDTFTGHVRPDPWASVMAICKASGKFVVRSPKGTTKTGWNFEVHGQPYATTEEVASVLMVQQMTDEEIKQETSAYLKAIGMEGKIFPVGMAKA